MKGWLKWGLIIIGSVIGLIFFGPILFTALSYVFKFLGVFCGWLSTAVAWLARVFDIFGFTGILQANAGDAVEEVKIIAQSAKLSIGGLFHG